MHSFRPVFAPPPCAPYPGDRSTPVTLDNWIHIALVGCHVPASALQSTAAVHPTGTFLTGSDALAAKKWASACEQTAIRARARPGGGIETRQILIYMRSLQLMLVHIVHRRDKHALAHFLAASTSKHTKKGAAGPLFRQLRIQRQLYTPQPPRPLRQLRLRRWPSTTPVLQLCTQRRLYTPKLPRTLWQSQSQH